MDFYKKVELLLKSGDLEGAYKMFEDNEHMLPGLAERTAHIIMYGCHGFSLIDKSKLKEQIHYFEKLISYLNLDVLKEGDLELFLRSLGYIVQTCAQYEFYGVFKSMRKFIIYPCDKLNLKEEEKKYCRIILKILYNSTIKLAAENNSKEQEAIWELGDTLITLSCTLKEYTYIENYISFLIRNGFLESTINKCIVKIIKKYGNGKDRNCFESMVKIAANVFEKSTYVGNCIEALDTWDAILNLFPNELQDDSYKILFFNDTYQKNFNLKQIERLKNAYKNPKLKFYVEQLSILILSRLFAIKNAKIISVAFLTSLFDLLEFIGGILVLIKTNCNCCKLNLNIYGIVNAIITIISMAMTIVKSQDAFILSEEFYKKLLDFIKIGCKYLERLYYSDCNKFNYTWNLLQCFGHNLIIQLYKSKHPQTINYVHELLTQKFKMEQVESDFFQKNSLQLLSIYIQTLCDEKKFEKALKLAALYVVLNTENRKIAFSSWNNVKNQLDKAFYNKTVCRVYEESLDYYKTLSYDFKKFTYDNEQLLLEELDILIAKWPQQLCFLGVITDLYETSSNQVVIDALLKLLKIKNFNYNLIKIIKELMEGLKKKNRSSENKIIIGCLGYLWYQIEYSKLVNDNLKNYKVPVEKHVKISVTNSCDLNNFSGMLKILINALQSLKDGMKSDLNKCSDLIRNYEILNVIFKMAFIFHIHSYCEYALETWMLLYEATKIINDTEKEVYSSGFILRYSEVNSTNFKTISKRVAQIEEDNLNNVLDLPLCSYYTNLSFAFLINGFRKEFADAYAQAAFYYYKLDNSETDEKIDAVRGYHMLLQSYIINIPCVDSVYKHEDFTLSSPYLAFKLLYRYLSTDSEMVYPFLLYVYFELIEFQLWTFEWQCSPRQLTCYAEDNIEFTQNNCFPLRAANMLIYAAKSNIFTCSQDECEVKLRRIDEILGLNLHASELVYANTAQASSKSTGSPTFFSQPFKMPNFIKHKNCSCTPCNNEVFQRIFLEKLLLEANFAELRNNISASSDYYQAIQDYIKSFPVKNNLEKLKPTIDSINLSYAKHNLRLKNIEEGRELLENLMSDLQEQVYKNYFLYNHVLNLMSSSIINYEINEKIKVSTPVQFQRHNFETPKIDLVKVNNPGTSKFNIYTPVPTKSKKRLEITAPKTCVKVNERPVSPKLLEKMDKLTKELQTCSIMNDLEETKKRPMRAVRKNLLSELKEPALPVPEETVSVTKTKSNDASKVKGRSLRKQKML